MKGGVLAVFALFLGGSVEALAVSSPNRQIMNSIILLPGTRSDAIIVAELPSKTKKKKIPAFKADLLRTIKAARAADSIFFTDANPMGPNRTVASVGKRAGNKLSGAELKRLRTIIISPDGYEDDDDLRKACPFVPTVGFQFRAGKQLVWWLVSKDCKMVALVKADDDWRRANIANIKGEAADVFIQLAGQ